MPLDKKPWEAMGCWREKKRDKAFPLFLVNLRKKIDWSDVDKASKFRMLVILCCLFCDV